MGVVDHLGLGSLYIIMFMKSQQAAEKLEAIYFWNKSLPLPFLSRRMKNCKGKVLYPETFEILMLRFLKFIYSEKATKFCEISNVDLTVTT